MCDWATLIDVKTLVGVIFGAALVWLGDMAKVKITKSKNAHFLAVRLVPIIEQFLDLCYDVAFDEGTVNGQPAGGDGNYEPQVKIPELILPNDVDWTSIDKNLLRRIIFLPNELETMRRLIASFSDHLDTPPYDGLMWCRRLEASKLSLKCDEILTSVREIISMPPKEYLEGWSPREKCSSFIEQAKDNLKK